MHFQEGRGSAQRETPGSNGNSVQKPVLLGCTLKALGAHLSGVDVSALVVSCASIFNIPATRIISILKLHPGMCTLVS